HSCQSESLPLLSSLVEPCLGSIRCGIPWAGQPRATLYAQGGHGFGMIKKAQPARPCAAYSSSTGQRTAAELVQEQVPPAMAIRLGSRLDIQAHKLNCIAHVCRLPPR